MSCNNRRRRKGTYTGSAIITGTLIVIICVLIMLIIHKQRKAGDISGTPHNTYSIIINTPSANTPTGTDSTAPISVETDATPSPVTSEAPETQGNPESPDIAAPTATSPTSALPSGYDYSKPVPQSAEVSKDSFSDAIFIGDSRMEDFGFFTGLAGKAKFYTHVGLCANHIISDNPEYLVRFSINGEKLTFEEAIQKYNDFSRVYIMLGYNELGWPNIDVFIQYYVKVINIVKNVRPDAAIYVECIIPVARQISGSGVDPETENNENIAKFNKAVMQMCEKNKYYYLNVQECLVDSEGYLPDESTNDGIHLKKDYCLKWYEYISRHVV